MPVVVIGEGAKNPLEVSSVGDQDPVEAFSALGADEAPGDRVGLRCFDRGPDGQGKSLASVRDSAVRVMHNHDASADDAKRFAAMLAESAQDAQPEPKEKPAKRAGAKKPDKARHPVSAVGPTGEAEDGNGSDESGAADAPYGQTGNIHASDGLRAVRSVISR
jgi:hypothetical protein